MQTPHTTPVDPLQHGRLLHALRCDTQPLQQADIELKDTRSSCNKYEGNDWSEGTCLPMPTALYINETITFTDRDDSVSLTEIIFWNQMHGFK